MSLLPNPDPTAWRPSIEKMQPGASGQMHAQSKKMPAAAGHRSLFARENVAGTASYSGAIFKRVAFPVDYVACAAAPQCPQSPRGRGVL